MDVELAKAVLPFLGGLLALIGGAFTFVNARLKEAETTDARARVWTWALLALFFALNLSGVVGFFLKWIGTALALCGAALVVQIVIFLRHPEPADRSETVTLNLSCCTYAAIVAIGISFHFIGRLLDLVEKLTKL